jgi:hypothetical protein
MVPFSYFQSLSYSRVMKERSLPSSPSVTLDPWPRVDPPPHPPRSCDSLSSPIGSGVDHRLASIIDRHAGPVGQTCRFAPIKKIVCLPRLPAKNPYEPNLFPETHPAPGVLHFLSVPIVVHPWFKNGGVYGVDHRPSHWFQAI